MRLFSVCLPFRKKHGKKENEALTVVVEDAFGQTDGLLQGQVDDRHAWQVTAV